MAHAALAEGVLISEKVPLAKVASLTTEEIHSDLGLLLLTLDKAYGGKGLLPRGQYGSLMEGLVGLQRKAAPGTSGLLCNQIAALTEKVNDFHLTVHIENQTCQRKWLPPTVGPNSGAASANPTWSVAFKEFQNQLVPVLAILTMTPSGSQDWNGFLETVQGLVNNARPFIIDLRRNPGGDSTKGYEMARLLYGLGKAQQVPMPKKQIYRRRTPEALSLMANRFWLEMQIQASQGRPVLEYQKANYLSQLNDRQRAIGGLIAPMEINQLNSERVDLSHAFRSPVYVLVDRDCGSSCELTLEALEKLPNVITVGENTTGVVKYGNVGALYLPASHIVIRIPTQGANYEDGRQVEKIGYAPKWKVPSGTDALSFTLNQFFR
jgi:hypothetical protein